MTDLDPFRHGEEGTHWACKEQMEKYGDKVKCCQCTGHKCKEEESKKLKLWVDDIRPAPSDDWIVARNINQAIRAIIRFEFEEISLDHDISHQVTVGGTSRPYPCGECFCAVAHFIATKYHMGNPSRIPVMTIHTSNPIGKDEMSNIFMSHGISVRVRMQGMSNRLEMQTPNV